VAPRRLLDHGGACWTISTGYRPVPPPNALNVISV
jgi:hypothetical protein